jgi:hypothetical protein
MKRGWLAVIAAILSASIPAVGLPEDKPFLTTSPTPDNEAWWLRTEYHPFGMDVRGIPATRIRAGWCKVNELRRDMFPAEQAQYFGDNQSPFAVDGFFGRSKTKHTALVGVYESCKGKRGAFLLIVAWPTGKPPLIRHLVELPGERQFAVVSASDDATITLQHCLECDHISEYKWDKSRKRFVLLPERNDE